jgi:hypothetical protein
MVTVFVRDCDLDVGLIIAMELRFVYMARLCFILASSGYDILLSDFTRSKQAQHSEFDQVSLPASLWYVKKLPTFYWASS